jgi:hypothetical protein
LRDAAAQFGRGLPDAVDGADDVFHQLIGMIRAAVGEFSFGERPNSFVGIEVRGIGGEMLDAQAAMSLEEALERLALVRGGIVEQHNDRSPEMPQQLAQEPADLLLPDVVKKEEIVEAQVMPPRAHRNSGNDGDLVAPSLAMAKNGSLALRSPGSDYVGDQQEARFIGKDDVGTQPRSVFFIRGLSFCFQRGMALSSRSSARRSGF